MKMSKKAYLNKKENFIEDGAITQNKAHRHSWYDGY